MLYELRMTILGTRVNWSARRRVPLPIDPHQQVERVSPVLRPTGGWRSSW